MQQVFQNLRIPIYSSEVQTVISMMDRSNSGSVSLEDFLAAMQKNMQSADYADLVPIAFDVFDQDRDGYLGTEDLGAALAGVYPGPTQAEIKELIACAARDG